MGKPVVTLSLDNPELFEFSGVSNPNTNTGLFGDQQNMRAAESETTTPIPVQAQPKTRAGCGFGKPRQTTMSSQTQRAKQQRTPSLFGPSNIAANTNLFGATNGVFGAGNQNSPFDQSPFGKPITTTSFGNRAAPVFGNANNSLFGSKTPGTTGGGLFGNTTATPAFGQPATSQSSFGGFSTPNTNTGLFGNQQNANTSLFGATNATPAFGQATKPTAFGFGASTETGLFGQTHQTTQQTTPSLFGPLNTAATTNSFGATSGFSGNNAAAGMTGTVVKFSPLTGSDTMVKNCVTQTISTRHYCITCMKEYEGKSLEELRLEDYVAGRKGQAKGAQTTGIFGSPAQPSIFGNTGVNTSTANTGFGAATAGFGATSQPATTTGLFEKPITGFGATATTSSTFPFNSTTTTSNPFGANAQAKPFGAAAPTPLFGSTNTTQPATTAFGTNNTNAFGSFGAPQPNQNIGLFNQNKPPFNMPASTASTGFSGFGQNTATNTTGGLFGAKPAGTATFGTTPSFGATPAPAFGTNTGFGTAPATGSLFNSSFKPAGQTGFSFGTTPATSTGLGVSSGLNLGTGSSIFDLAKPGGFSDIPKTNMSSNSTNAFLLKNDFSIKNNTAAPCFDPAGERVGSHPTPVLDQVNESVVALALDKTEKCLKSENLATQTSINPRSQVDTEKSSSNAELQAVKKTQPSEKSLSMEKKEVSAAENCLQSLKVVKEEKIVSPSTTIRTRSSSSLSPLQNIESQNSKSDEEAGAKQETQTLSNSIDIQTDPQSLSESRFGSTNTTQPAAAAFGTNNTKKSYARRSSYNFSFEPATNTSGGLFAAEPAGTATFGTGLISGATAASASGTSTSLGTAPARRSRFNFSFEPATNTSGRLFAAEPAGTATFGTGLISGATAASASGTSTSLGTAPARRSRFNFSFGTAGQTGLSFGTTPATSTGLGVSSGLNLGTGSSIFDLAKPGGFSDIPKTNMSSNSTNAFLLKNDFSIKNNTAAPRFDPAGERVGSHPTPVLDQVNESVVALALDKTEKCLKSENLATQTSINPRSQVGTEKSSSNAELQAVKKTQPSVKSLSMEKKEVSAAENCLQSLKVVKEEKIVSPSTTIRTRSSSSLSPLQNIESQNSKSDEEAGAKQETQTLSNSIDIQIDPQSLSESRFGSTNTTQPAAAAFGTNNTETHCGFAVPPPDEIRRRFPWYSGGRFKAHEEAGANQENQTPTNSIDNQTDLQCLSKSTMSISVSDGTLNSTPNVDESLFSSSHSSGTSHKLDVTSVMSSHTKQRPNVACNTPRCAGYYVIPPLEKLDEYVCGHTCMMPNFTRGLKGYGNYYQPHSFDIYSLDLDEIVHFRNEKIIIYPYDDQRPPIGQDLDHSAKALTEDMIATDSPGLILITSKWSQWSRR